MKRQMQRNMLFGFIIGLFVSAQYLAALVHIGEACGSLFKEAHFYLYNASLTPQIH